MSRKSRGQIDYNLQKVRERIGQARNCVIENIKYIILCQHSRKNRAKAEKSKRQNNRDRKDMRNCSTMGARKEKAIEGI